MSGRVPTSRKMLHSLSALAPLFTFSPLLHPLFSAFAPLQILAPQPSTLGGVLRRFSPFFPLTLNLRWSVNAVLDIFPFNPQPPVEGCGPLPDILRLFAEGCGPLPDILRLFAEGCGPPPDILRLFAEGCGALLDILRLFAEGCGPPLDILRRFAEGCGPLLDILRLFAEGCGPPPDILRLFAEGCLEWRRRERGREICWKNAIFTRFNREEREVGVYEYIK